MTITGTGFFAGAAVTIGGVPATSVMTIGAPTTLTATTGPGTAGAADVVVTVNGRSGRLAGGFTYETPRDVRLSFTVYNHTAGPMGTFTQTARSFEDVTLRIAVLGSPAGDGPAAPAAINVAGVDPHRIVVRHAAQGRWSCLGSTSSRFSRATTNAGSSECDSRRTGAVEGGGA